MAYPINPIDGQEHTEQNKKFAWDSASGFWNLVISGDVTSPFTIGDVKQSILSADHNGWLIMDSSGISPSQFSKISDAGLASSWASLGGTPTARPDLRERALAMASTSRPLGTKSGALAGTLVTSNIPNHDHKYAVTSLTGSKTSGNNSAGHTHQNNPGSTGTTSVAGTGNSTFKYVFNTRSGSAIIERKLRDTQGGVDEMMCTTAPDSDLSISDSTHTHAVDIAEYTSGGNSVNHTHSTDLSHGHAVTSTALATATEHSIEQPTAYVNHFIYVGI